MLFLTKKTKAISVWILLLFFTQCDPPEKGIDLAKEKEQVGLDYTDTVTIESSIVLVDSINTSNVNNVLMGGYTDPIFGKVKATSYLPFVPKDLNITLPADAIFDSLLFIINYDYVYGDTLGVNTVQAFELTENLTTEANVNYYKFNTSSFNPSPLSNVVSFKSTLRSNPYLRIRLNDTKGIEFFQKIKDKSSEFSSAENFRNYFKGIALVGNTNSSIVGISLSSQLTNIILYYHQPGQDLNSAFVFSPSYKYYTSFTSDFSGTPLAGLVKYQEVPTSQFNNLCYVQNGTGVLTKISFPYIHSFKERMGKNVMINKAELILPVVQQDAFLLPASLTLSYTNSSQRVPTYTSDRYGNCNPIIVPQDNPAIVYGLTNPCDQLEIGYDSESKSYTTPVTFLLQAIINGRIKDASFFIFPLGVPTSGSIFKRYMSSSRAVLGDPKNTSAKMKLKIYYTIVN